jgi:hypothetical protein
LSAIKLKKITFLSTFQVRTTILAMNQIDESLFRINIVQENYNQMIINQISFQMNQILISIKKYNDIIDSIELTHPKKDIDNMKHIQNFNKFNE